jgi:thiosulfate/3-mercaptopyruvate sulfurtransferase
MKKCFAVAALLSVISLAACAGIGTSPKGLEAPIEKASIGIVSDVKDGGYQLIDAEGLNKWLVEKKNLILIDSNPKPAYDKAHLIGSVSSTIPRIGKELAPLHRENILKIAGNDKNKTIVVYCGFTACQRSHWGAKILVDHGYKNVYRFPGGIVSWQEYGFPVEGK